MNEEIPGEELPKGIHKLKSFKVIIIGDSNVGKTCLSFRFCEGRYPKTVESTIGVDFRERKVKIGPEEITLQLWDTAGQERFRQSMVPHYYRNADAAVFVYDVTRISTLESLPTYISECERLCSSSLPRILVGNKCDLSSNIKVKTQMAQEFADKYDMPVFETSAKEDSFCDHVDSIFTTLALKLGSSQPFKFPSLCSSPDDDGIVVIGEKSNEEEENWCC